MVHEKVAQVGNKTRPVFRRAGWAVALGWLVGALAGRAAPTSGEAVVAAMTGHAEGRVFTAPVHEGRTGLRPLFEGAALHENSRVLTGKDGRLCMVMSPGAIVCVAPQTQFQIEQLRHTAAGLPRYAADIIRRIHLHLERGRIRVHAGAPLPTLDIRIATPAGVIEAQGGEFVVAEGARDQWLVFQHAGTATLTPRDGEPVTLRTGDNARLTLAGGRATAQTDGVPNDPARESFELCNVFFGDLEPFIDNPLDFDREGLGNYLGLTTSFQDVDDGALVTDASPTIRPVVAGAQPTALPRAGENSPGGRWGARRVWDWYHRQGVIKGVNYIPRTAVNSVEMWQEATFDPDTIDEELGWAQEIGYTSIRVQLQFAVWQADRDGFLARVDKVLQLAAKHGLRMVPVLFDDLDVAGHAPVPGPQPEPVPGEYNSQWVPSPDPAMVTERSRWPELEKYVKDVMGRFKRDARVQYWDLYNTAGNSGLWEESLPLLDQTFNWARSVEAAQPLAVAAWKEFGSAMAARKLERSDLITFQSYDTPEAVEARLMLLQQYKRPIICSGWLMRQTGNQFDKILPLFAMGHVGWFNQGLVAGRTQLEVQQANFRSERDPDLWQQNVLQNDGTPYDRREVELIQGFQFVGTPE